MNKDLFLHSEVIIGQEELTEKIARGQKLKVKFGVDPTRPDLTFGHLVVFNKLKQFQDAGHEAILLIGDYTARIGDPSGKSELRPELSKQEVEENARTYLNQAFRILDENKTIVRRNSEWFSKMSFADSLKLTRKMTVARMLERDDFQNRFKENQPISMVEFMYPLVQGYDSVILESDLEIGGSDQLFNMLVGRSLQKDMGMEPQAVLTMPLLVGLDGARKMSKSYDNYIAFNDNAKDVFGKIMSVSDQAMLEYFRLLLQYHDNEMERLDQLHPMDAKKLLAFELTALFHGKEAAENERGEFGRVFSQGSVPKEMPTFPMSGLNAEKPTILNLLAATELFESKGYLRRVLRQGGVKLDGQRVDDADLMLNLEANRPERIVKVGKKTFIRFTD